MITITEDDIKESEVLGRLQGESCFYCIEYRNSKPVSAFAEVIKQEFGAVPKNRTCCHLCIDTMSWIGDQLKFRLYSGIEFQLKEWKEWKKENKYVR